MIKDDYLSDDDVSSSDDSSSESDSKKGGANENDTDIDDEEDDDDIDDENNIDEDDEPKKKQNKSKKNTMMEENAGDTEDDDDNDDDDNENENYLQKFEENIKQNIITDYHPELRVNNYDEIAILSKIVRDENGIIIDPLHKTLPFITKYERARILGERAKQINSDAKTFVNVEPNVIDGYLIALEEYKQKKIPFIIRRPLPSGGIEYWRFCDLEQI
jgi:DNA-directed RNA polymerase I, II, and III subunit RPABC2